MSQLELEQSEQRGVFSEHFLDMHIYMTSALGKEDMKALGLQLALELIHEKKDKDLITGLRTRTKPGRPNWDKVGNDFIFKLFIWAMISFNCNYLNASKFVSTKEIVYQSNKLFIRKTRTKPRQINWKNNSNCSKIFGKLIPFFSLSVVIKLPESRRLRV